MVVRVMSELVARVMVVVIVVASVVLNVAIVLVGV